MYNIGMDEKPLKNRPAAKGLLICLLTCMALLCASITQGGGAMSLKIESPDFRHGKEIPLRFSCDGHDISPQLVWSGAPEGTESFVLTLEDPDAPSGVFIHWVVYDLAPSLKGLEEGDRLKGAKQGKTSFGDAHYGGPCPPRGHGVHRYIFTLRALDIPSLGLPPGSGKSVVEDALKGHVLAEASITGTYKR